MTPPASTEPHSLRCETCENWMDPEFVCKILDHQLFQNEYTFIMKVGCASHSAAQQPAPRDDVPYLREGAKVRFTCKNPVTYGIPKENAEHLVLNNIYTVERVKEDDWLTTIYLKEFRGISFNSVWFDVVLPQQPAQNYEDGNYYPIREGELRSILGMDHIPKNAGYEEIIKANTKILATILNRQTIVAIRQEAERKAREEVLKILERGKSALHQLEIDGYSTQFLVAKQDVLGWVEQEVLRSQLPEQSEDRQP